MKVPDLIVKNRKYNQMEIEMDKFLAKKNPVFKQDPADKDSYGLGVNLTEQAIRYKLNGTILQLVLKSMYENTRKYVYTVHAYQQL